jgi:hypothetical protein
MKLEEQALAYRLLAAPKASPKETTPKLTRGRAQQMQQQEQQKQSPSAKPSAAKRKRGPPDVAEEAVEPTPKKQRPGSGKGAAAAKDTAQTPADTGKKMSQRQQQKQQKQEKDASASGAAGSKRVNLTEYIALAKRCRTEEKLVQALGNRFPSGGDTSTRELPLRDLLLELVPGAEYKARFFYFYFESPFT